MFHITKYFNSTSFVGGGTVRTTFQVLVSGDSDRAERPERPDHPERGSEQQRNSPTTPAHPEKRTSELGRNFERELRRAPGGRQPQRRGARARIRARRGQRGR